MACGGIHELVNASAKPKTEPTMTAELSETGGSLKSSPACKFEARFNCPEDGYWGCWQVVKGSQKGGEEVRS